MVSRNAPLSTECFRSLTVSSHFSYFRVRVVAFRYLSILIELFMVYGYRVYTLKKVDPDGKPTLSAHPARFSPDDKFSRHRVVIKRRFKVLPSERRPQPL